MVNRGDVCEHDLLVLRLLSALIILTEGRLRVLARLHSEFSSRLLFPDLSTYVAALAIFRSIRLTICSLPRSRLISNSLLRLHGPLYLRTMGFDLPSLCPNSISFFHVAPHLEIPSLNFAS